MAALQANPAYPFPKKHLVLIDKGRGTKHAFLFALVHNFLTAAQPSTVSMSHAMCSLLDVLGYRLLVKVCRALGRN